MAEYQQFLQGLFERLNAGRKPRPVEEMKVMQELPERRMESCKRVRVRVDSGSLIYVDRNVYSVPSRLVGEQVEARLYMDQIEVWYGQKKVEQLQRLRGRQKLGPPTLAARSGQVAEHKLHVRLERGFRCRFQTPLVVQLAGVAAQMLDQGSTHPGVSEGLDQHVHDGNKLRVVERIPVVMCKPVFKLHFAETQQGCFRVCGLLAVIPARRWRSVRARVAAVKGR